MAILCFIHVLIFKTVTRMKTHASIYKMLPFKNVFLPEDQIFWYFSNVASPSESDAVYALGG